MPEAGRNPLFSLASSTTVRVFKHHQISSNTALNPVFGEDGYMADEAEMGLIRLIPDGSTRMATLMRECMT